MRTLRLFAILDRLRASRRPVSAENLAESLDVTPRTIYRDMAALQAMGAPIRGEGGVGYQIENGFFLPPLHFDADELDAIIMGMQMVTARADEALADAAINASAKIAAVLSPDVQERFYESPFLAYSKQADSDDGAGRYLSPIRTAIRERRKLHIAYCDLTGRKSERTVRPLGMTAFDTVWLMTAWCENKDDFRNFRIDRLTAADQTGERFRNERGKRFTDYIRTL